MIDRGATRGRAPRLSDTMPRWMPDAARISDLHVCPRVEPGPVPHVGGPIFSGSANVIIGHRPAARVGDRVVCMPIGPTDKIAEGSSTVIINHRAAARRTDPCTHIDGSRIAAGCPSVVIGDAPQSFTFRAAARRGTPFCEECERRRREMEDRDDSAAPDPDTLTLDDDPPPGVDHGRDELGARDIAELAASVGPDTGGDGLARRAARIGLAWSFLVGKAGGRVKPSKVHAQIGGIDLARPVEVVSISDQTLHQLAIPGAGNGQYFTHDAGATPDQLGISPTAYRRNAAGESVPPAVLREPRQVVFGAPAAFGLKSTAAPIKDTWSLAGSSHAPAQAVDCAGGGTQVMVPHAYQTATTIQP